MLVITNRSGWLLELLTELIILFSPDVDGTASASETNCGGGGGKSGRFEY